VKPSCSVHRRTVDEEVQFADFDLSAHTNRLDCGFCCQVGREPCFWACDIDARMCLSNRFISAAKDHGDPAAAGCGIPPDTAVIWAKKNAGTRFPAFVFPDKVFWYQSLVINDCRRPRWQIEDGRNMQTTMPPTTTRGIRSRWFN